MRGEDQGFALDAGRDAELDFRILTFLIRVNDVLCARLHLFDVNKDAGSQVTVLKRYAHVRT